VNVPDEAIDYVRRRLVATRWPDKETVGDRSQGAQLAKFQDLVRYWATDYDWRKAEAKLNALPQFVTTIDGLDIHFIHIRSPHADALPLITTHGWPGSIFELLKVIEPLTDPTAHGGSPEDAIHLVISPRCRYGFSEIPKTTGWGPDRTAPAWHVLMRRLGYERSVSQGGDWGSVVADVMARHAQPGLLGIHVYMPATVPPEIAKSLTLGEPAPGDLSPDEKRAHEGMASLYQHGSGYAPMMVTRPQTMGYALSDSPVGLAAWFHDTFADWTFSGGDPERSLTKDEMLDDISLYWFTNTATSGARLYWEKPRHRAASSAVLCLRRNNGSRADSRHGHRRAAAPGGEAWRTSGWAGRQVDRDPMRPPLSRPGHATTERRDVRRTGAWDRLCRGGTRGADASVSPETDAVMVAGRRIARGSNVVPQRQQLQTRSTSRSRRP